MAKISDIENTDYIGFIWGATLDEGRSSKTKWICIQMNDGTFLEAGIEQMDDIDNFRERHSGYDDIKEMLTAYYSPSTPSIVKILRFPNEQDMYEWLKEPL